MKHKKWIKTETKNYINIDRVEEFTISGYEKNYFIYAYTTGDANGIAVAGFKTREEADYFLEYMIFCMCEDYERDYTDPIFDVELAKKVINEADAEEECLCDECKKKLEEETKNDK